MHFIYKMKYLMANMLMSLKALILGLFLTLLFTSCFNSQDLSISDHACINCAEEYVEVWLSLDAFAKEFENKVNSGELNFKTLEEQQDAFLSYIIADSSQYFKRYRDFKAKNSDCFHLNNPEKMKEFLSPKWQLTKN